MAKQRNLGFSTFELILALVIVCILGTIFLSKFGEVRQNNRNEQRKSDVVAIQTAIDTYKATNSKYPSLSQINNPAFRKESLRTLNDNYIKDPVWSKTNTLCSANGLPIFQSSTTPSSGCYGYAVSPTGCDNTAITCTSYSLVTNIEPGQTYTKVSSD